MRAVDFVDRLFCCLDLSIRLVADGLAEVLRSITTFEQYSAIPWQSLPSPISLGLALYCPAVRMLYDMEVFGYSSTTLDVFRYHLEPETDWKHQATKLHRQILGVLGVLA